MVRLEKYEPKYKLKWNEFLNNSKNGVFLFSRDYMEYHSDRFKDYSLLFFDNQELIAILPANIKDNILYSHGGLTFGGIISSSIMRTPLMLEIFNVLMQHLKTQGIKKVIYKAMPHIYHSIPAEEDLYALFLHDAQLIRRDLAATILMDNKVPFNRTTRQGINKIKKNGLSVERSYDFKTFITLKEKQLLKDYGVRAVHSPEEMQLLAERFPENIKLFSVSKNHSMLAGIIIYEGNFVAHGQYGLNTEEGKKMSVLDLIFDFLLNYYTEKKYFDFGISTEDNGRYLNLGLTAYKEKFGARAIVYDFYELNIA